MDMIALYAVVLALPLSVFAQVAIRCRRESQRLALKHKREHQRLAGYYARMPPLA
jgi:hypothetical protein